MGPTLQKIVDFSKMFFSSRNIWKKNQVHGYEVNLALYQNFEIHDPF